MKKPSIKATAFRAIGCVTGVSALFMAGCATTPKAITVEPEAQVITPGEENDIDLNVTFNVPAHYLSSRSMATIEPVLILGDSVVEKFEPYVLKGKTYVKKEERLRRLYGVSPDKSNNVQVIKDNGKPITLTMNEQIELINSFDSGRIEAYVTHDGCGECYGRDTLEIAYLSNLSSLIDASSLMVQWIDTVPPETVKSFEDEAEARLQFKVNETTIIPSLANNRAELDSMLKTLTPIFTDTLFTLEKLDIFGSASAEGPYKNNVKLARGRATAAKDWLDSQVHMTKQQKNTISIDFEPEGWWPVVASMHAAGDADSIKVKRIIERYPDVTSDKAEKEIRKLDCWRDIADHHLAKDRRVKFHYKWKVKSYETPEEALAMYRVRPETLNELEYLRAASMLTDDMDELISLYETFATQKPKSEIAIHNLAALYYENGQYQDAINLLKKQKKPTSQMATTLAMCYVMMGDDEKAMEALKGINSENASEIMGVLQARNHMMGDAYSNLAGVQDLNAAIAALGVNKNEEAWQILSELDDKSPRADYVRAIAMVRLGDNDQSLKYLKHAVQDPQLRQRAASEADFRPLRNEWKFKQYIGQE